MSHGTSIITKRSKLSKQHIDVLLTAKFFTDPPKTRNLADYTNFFVWNAPANDIERSIINVLEQENVHYRDMKIEYWFQHKMSGQDLSPHCDYNHFVREDCSYMNDGAWLHLQNDKTRIMSPITVGCYLQTDNLKGGEFCISSHTWFEEPTPMLIEADKIKQHPYEIYKPEVGDIIFFEGSKYYHWINPVETGERKSMMINFWPQDL